MKFIEEVVVEEFLPTVRSMLADRLSERGLTQREIATALGVSQSAVSKYVHGEVRQHDRIMADERVENLVEEIAEGMADGSLSRVGALVEIEVLIRQLERDDVLSTLQAEAMPGLAERNLEAAIHDPESDLRTEAQVLASVRRGLKTLEASRAICELIPNVGANLVESLPEARNIDDVAGVPGRLFAIRGRLEIPAEPEFGASEHVASVLLAARASGAGASAALNVRFDPAVVDVLTAAGCDVVEFDGEYDDLDAAIEAALAADPDPDVLYHTGGFGVEPIVYLLGPDAPTVAETVDELW